MGFALVPKVVTMNTLNW